MKCRNCGNEIDNDSLFCEYCGAKIEVELQQPVQTPPVPPVPPQVPQQPLMPQPPQVPQQPQNVVVEAAPVEEAKTVCSKCGAELAPGQKFCMNCGGQAAVTMVKNLLHHSLRAPSAPGEFTVPMGPMPMGGGMSAMQPAMAMVSAGVQAARSAMSTPTNQYGSQQPYAQQPMQQPYAQQPMQQPKTKKKPSKVGRFFKNIGMRLFWTGFSAGMTYLGYYIYQHKDSILAWFTGLFS